MKRALISAVAAIVLFGAVSASQATVVFRDDFESPDSPADTWFTAFDADPTTPVIGQNWSVVEASDHNLQEVGHPNNPAAPSFAAYAGAQYLHGIAQISENTQAWAPISAADQALIAADAFVRVSAAAYGLSGLDGWRSDLRIVGFDSPPTTIASPAFDIRLTDGGVGLAGTVTYTDGTGTHTVPGLVNDVNVWQTLTIDVDFNTDTFSLTLDGVTVPGLTWAGGNLSKIQSVMLAWDNTNRGTNRGGWDELTILVPEPGSVTMLLAGGVLLFKRRRA